MSAAAAILEGMPDPRDLRRLDTGGGTVIFAGPAELFRFAAHDTAMRHVAAAVLRQLKFPGKDVAAVLGLSAAYVATLHQRALREGTAALVRASDPDGARSILTQERYASIEVHSWRFGGRPA